MLMLMYVWALRVKERKKKREEVRVSDKDRKKEYINNYHIKTLATWAECWCWCTFERWKSLKGGDWNRERKSERRCAWAIKREPKESAQERDRENRTKERASERETESARERERARHTHTHTQRHRDTEPDTHRDIWWWTGDIYIYVNPYCEEGGEEKKPYVYIRVQPARQMVRLHELHYV